MDTARAPAGSHSAGSHSAVSEFVQRAFHWERQGERQQAEAQAGRAQRPHGRALAGAEADGGDELEAGGELKAGGELGAGSKDSAGSSEVVALQRGGGRRLLARGGAMLPDTDGLVAQLAAQAAQQAFMNELLQEIGHVQDDAEQLKAEGSHGVGCHMEGYLEVAKLSGHVQVNPGRTFQLSTGQVVQMQVDAVGFNMSHTIHGLSFGASYPGKVEPLSGAARAHASLGGASQYFLKVVPTTYHRGRTQALTNQYSFTETPSQAPAASAAGAGAQAGLFLHYEIWPIRVHVTHARSTLAEFLTSVCAIVGGTVALASVAAGFMGGGVGAEGAAELVSASKAVLGR